jgi:hypothetical protein
MAGYSGTPLPKKLGIKDGARVGLIGAPDRFDRTLGKLPPGVDVRTLARGPFDVVVVFVTRVADLERRFPPLVRALEPDGGLWVAWPKQASGVSTDLRFENVQRVGLDTGLVDNKSCAIDETWSGLRFVYRVADRPGVRSGSRPTRREPEGRVDLVLAAPKTDVGVG